MSDLPKGPITAAATFSLVSFLTLLIGVPLMLKDMAQLEHEMMQQRQVYMDMVKKYFVLKNRKNFLIKSNNMWRDVMDQGEITRKESAAYGIRQRRQCMKNNV